MYYLPAGKHKGIKNAKEYDSTRTVDALSEWVNIKKYCKMAIKLLE